MDSNLLKFLYDDNQKVEPEWYIPIIPMVLVNGAEGIGTGWACKIPNYDVREIVNNINRMLSHQEALQMVGVSRNAASNPLDSDLCSPRLLAAPQLQRLQRRDPRAGTEPVPGQRGGVGPRQEHHRDHRAPGPNLDAGTSSARPSARPGEQLQDQGLSVVSPGVQAYKESVLEPMLQGSDKTPALISDYKEYHTDTTVKFLVRMSEEKLAQAEAVGLHKVFKLQSSLTCNSMVSASCHPAARSRLRAGLPGSLCPRRRKPRTFVVSPGAL